MEERARVPYAVAVDRLHQFEHLSQMLSDSWLKTQIRKPVEQYSLIAGWLTTSELDWNWTYGNLTAALDAALAIFAGNVSEKAWRKLHKKICAHSDRAETKGTLAEISLAVFLVQHHIPFEMETKLNPTSNKKDVDFSLQFDGLEPVHIEMQWVSESDSLVRAADALSPYKLPATIDFPQEETRILNIVYSKTSKFIRDEITLVALDCTTFPEIGGPSFAPIRDALTHTLGNQIYGPLSEKATTIRDLADGVIWFESDPGKAFFPTKRGYILNQHSPHLGKLSLSRWVECWSGTNGEDS